MYPRRVLAIAIALLSFACLVAPARAFDQFVGTRALGTGGAMRAAAAGGEGPLLNPAGMSLTQSYSVEAAYLFASADTQHYFHASVVDSTSGFRVAGGLYYTYHTDNPDGQTAGHGHEVGLALSFPFSEYFALGGTVKYFSLSGDQASVDSNRQITFDGGFTIHPTPVVSLGLVGTNLRDLHTGVAPMSLGYGAAFMPNADLMIVVDGQTLLTADLPLGRKGTRVGGGAELLLAKKIALRVGGGYDGVSENGYFSAGFSAVSEVGAVDLGIRQDAFQHGGTPRQTFAGLTLRLFVPQP